MFPRTTYRMRQLPATLAARRHRLGSDAGSATVEIISWAAMSVVAIVAIGAALRTLGVDIIDYVRTQLGV